MRYRFRVTSPFFFSREPYHQKSQCPLHRNSSDVSDLPHNTDIGIVCLEVTNSHFDVCAASSKHQRVDHAESPPPSSLDLTSSCFKKGRKSLFDLCLFLTIIGAIVHLINADIIIPIKVPPIDYCGVRKYGLVFR